MVLEDRHGARDRDPDPEGDEEQQEREIVHRARLAAREADARQERRHEEHARQRRDRGEPPQLLPFFSGRPLEPLDEPHHRGDRQAGEPQPADPDGDVESSLQRGDTEGILRLGRRRHVDDPGPEHHRERQQRRARDQRDREPAPRPGWKPARREQQQDQRDRGYDEERPVVHPGDRRPERQRARRGFQRVLGVFLGRSAPEHAEPGDQEQPADRVPRHAPREHGPHARIRAEERDAQQRERVIGERVVQRREDDRGDEERSAGHEQGRHQTPASAVGRFPWLRLLHEADAYTPANRRKGGQTCWLA